MPFFYYYDPYYWMLLVPAMLIALVAQMRVSSTFNRFFPRRLPARADRRAGGRGSTARARGA